MADNLNEHSEQIIGLTELMVQTLQATIDADRSTADEYYRILEENSFKAFHAKMGSTKDRNGMDLREAEDIKKRWQEYTEEL